MADEICNAMVRSLALTFGSAKPVCATAVGSFDCPHALAAASVSNMATAVRMPNYMDAGGEAPFMSCRRWGGPTWHAQRAARTTFKGYSLPSTRCHTYEDSFADAELRVPKRRYWLSLG